ncbi:hypothetical protein [Vineibacter terrae]|uniref:hypothetical protein n=1 Tax=Vineibacter terrae TaxID=2586908 RepID=UPI002E33B0EC|nr:hypothetical protein [Vineibacter terrae]HEX2885451.1 hypothetical protein [Vineibacter terrae]
MGSVGDVDALRRAADVLGRQAAAAERAYERRSWLKLAVVLFPVPILVALFRLRLDAWGYYILGASYVALACLMLVLDRRDVAIRERARQAADRARDAYAEASAGPTKNHADLGTDRR